ncbi:MAG TPA: AMP-binding protein, partial [Pseudolabrys sp.]
MILGEGSRTAGTAATLDDLFRRAGVSHPDALALADPPNREDFTDGSPRALTFAQADRAISAFAGRLRGLGLGTDTVVAMQLPNTVDSIVAFLGVLRGGMIAAPIPLLWRPQEIISALGRIGAKAIVTTSRIGTAAHADIAMQSAAALFPIRQVCGFGRGLPDGVVSLDGVFTSNHVDMPAAPTRLGPAAAHVAAITFDLDYIPVARSHVELVAGGLETFLEAGSPAETPTLSTIPLGSFAGISLTVLHWLLSGGSLHLHHGFDPNAFAAQGRELDDATVMLPAATITSAADAGLLANPNQTVVALWRAPERMISASAWGYPSAVVDVACFGEIGLVSARRGTDHLPALIPHGVVDASRRVPGAPTVIETVRSDAGTLAVRGRMVPTHAFPPGAERGHAPRLQPNRAGYVDTGFPCRLDHNAQGFSIIAPPAGTIAIGGYRFRQTDVDALIAQTDPGATMVAVPDADLGQRLAGAAADRSALRAELQALGVNP